MTMCRVSGSDNRYTCKNEAEELVCRRNPPIMICPISITDFLKYELAPQLCSCVLGRKVARPVNLGC